MNWYLQVLRKYAVFSGRARRKEYWMFMLVNALISAALFLVDVLMGAAKIEAGLGILSGIYSLAVLLPSLAVSIRRLHDTGRSGWMCLVSLIPIIGAFVVLYYMVSDSQPGANVHGANPKETRVAMAA